MGRNLLRAAVAAATTIASIVASGGAASAEDPIGDWKRAHDSDPHVRLTGQDILALQAKQDAAKVRSLKRMQNARTAGAEYLQNNLSAIHQAQQTSYWCGPAALVISLLNRNISMTQATAATLMKTTQSAGTAWSGVNATVPSPTGYPMRDVYNYKLGYTEYFPLALPYSPTSADVTSFKYNLMDDIDRGFPVMGNAYEIVGGPHLPGHPNMLIFHWVNIRGYSYSATQTNISDPAASPHVSWGANVPKFSSVDTAKMVRVMGGRGYVF